MWYGGQQIKLLAATRHVRLCSIIAFDLSQILFYNKVLKTNKRQKIISLGK